MTHKFGPTFFRRPYLRSATLRAVDFLIRNTLQLVIMIRQLPSEVGFAELKETADDRANIGAPSVGQQFAQYILTDHQDADSRRMIRLILSRQLQASLYRADVPANIVSLIIGSLALDRCLGYHRSTNLRFIKARPILSLSFIYRPLIFDICALVWPSFIDRYLLLQY